MRLEGIDKFIVPKNDSPYSFLRSGTVSSTPAAITSSGASSSGSLSNSSGFLIIRDVMGISSDLLTGSGEVSSVLSFTMMILLIGIRRHGVF